MNVDELKKDLLIEAENLQIRLVKYNMDSLEHVNLDWDDKEFENYNERCKSITDRLLDVTLSIQEINSYLKKKNSIQLNLNFKEDIKNGR